MKIKIICFLFTTLIFTSCKQESSTTAEDQPFYYSSDQEFINKNEGLSDSAFIGKLIFFDKNLSEPIGVSCATCHSPMTAFSDPRHTAFSEGSNHQFGNRNANAISYMTFAPNRRSEIVRGVWETVGGFFWDGKAEFLNQQALFPFINTHEMNNPGIGALAIKIKNASYYSKLEQLFGSAALADSQTIAYYTITCLQAFEQSFQVNPFTSKFDFYLKGKTTLTKQEKRGMVLFNDSTKAKCGLCHLSSSTTYASTNKILFTDYEQGYAIIELIGEWNDAIENDIMTLRRDITDVMFKEGITKFILIAENVLNFHSSDDSYYEEWHEQLEDDGGWVVILDMPQQSQHDFKRSRLTNYVGLLDFPQWRTLKPEVVFQQVDNWMLRQLK